MPSIGFSQGETPVWSCVSSQLLNRWDVVASKAGDAERACSRTPAQRGESSQPASREASS